MTEEQERAAFKVWYFDRFGWYPEADRVTDQDMLEAWQARAALSQPDPLPSDLDEAIRLSEKENAAAPATSNCAEAVKARTDGPAILERAKREAKFRRESRDESFEAVRQRLCQLQRYSFILGPGASGVRRVEDNTGRWVEFSEVHELFDPVVVDAALASTQAAASSGK